MAEINTGGGGGGKHQKKGRKHHGNPRVDMTPMVDLAFLLLTFFVLTSNLNKAKTLELAVPKENTDTNIKMEVDTTLANTVLIDGNKEGILYIYSGKYKPEALAFYEKTLDTKDPKESFRQFILYKNSKVNGEMKTLRVIFKSGKFTQPDFDKIAPILADKAKPNAIITDTVVIKRRKEAYDTAMARLKIDLKRGVMSDTTYKMVAGNIRNDDKAPFFIIKWGGDARYSDVINVIDELRIGDATKYALTKISQPELQGLSAKTGRKYPDLKPLPPAGPGPN
jgi:biopolymer transport protein ExbD